MLFDFALSGLNIFFKAPALNIWQLVSSLCKLIDTVYSVHKKTKDTGNRVHELDKRNFTGKQQNKRTIRNKRHECMC